MTSNYGIPPCPFHIKSEPLGLRVALYEQPIQLALSIQHQNIIVNTMSEVLLRERISLLNEIWLAYRKELFADQTDQIIWKSPRRLILRSGCADRTEKKRPGTFSPLMKFPEHLCKKPQDRAILLNFLQCNVAVTHMQDVLEWLIKDISKKIEVAAFLLKEPPLVVTLEPDGGPQISNAEYTHECWRITLKNDQVYAVDLAGAQYGWSDPVCSWQECLKKCHESGENLRIGSGEDDQMAPLIASNPDIPEFAPPRVDNYYVSVRQHFLTHLTPYLENLKPEEYFVSRGHKGASEAHQLVESIRQLAKAATLAADKVWDTFPWEKFLHERSEVVEKQRLDLVKRGIGKL